MNKKSLAHQLEQLSENYRTEIDHIDTFRQYISNNECDINILEQTTKENQICGAQIINGQLSFQCFTCSENKNHLICHQCFDITQNQSNMYNISIDHHCFIYPKEGQCDCGDINIIKREGHCSKHQLHNPQELQYQVQSLPIELELSIENFLQQISQVYCHKMSQMEQQYHKYDKQIIYFYQIIEEFEITPLQNIIDSKMNIKNYYREAFKAQYLHEMLFTFMEWLTNSRPIFLNLIRLILQKKISSNQTLYENIIIKQSLLEIIAPSGSYSIQPFLSRLCEDAKFRDFAYHVNIATYSNHWFSLNQSYSQYYRQIDDIRERIDQSNEEFNLSNKDLIKQIADILTLYIAEVKKPVLLKKCIFTNEIHSWLALNCDQNFLTIFLEGIHQVEIFKMISQFQKEIHSSNFVTSLYPNFAFQLFSSLFETKGFAIAAMRQFEEILSSEFNSFMNSPAYNMVLKNFKMNDFILTALINCLSEAKPISMAQFNGNFDIFEDQYDDICHYFCYQQLIFSTIYKGLQQFLNCGESTEIFRKNFLRLLLKNEISILEQELKFQYADQQFINSRGLIDQNTVRTKYRKIILYLLKNASFLDKLFINLLWLDYCYQAFQQPIDYRNYLQDLFEDSIDSIKYQFQQIMERCVQTYAGVYCSTNEKLEKIYLNLYEKEEEEEGQPNISLVSFDQAFNKLYLYVFDIQGLYDVYGVFNALQIPTLTIKCSITDLLLLKILSSDIDVYNLCYSFFHQNSELPLILNNAFAKIVQNIMNLQQFISYSTIEFRFKDLGISYSEQSKRHILKFCEPESSVKKLKLKKQYQQTYDPVVMVVNKQLMQIMLARLQDRSREERVILFGDGLEWNLKQCINNSSSIQLHLLYTISSIKLMEDNLQVLSQYRSESSQTYLLLDTQIMAASHFRSAELQSNQLKILSSLQNIHQRAQEESKVYSSSLLQMIKKGDYFQKPVIAKAISMEKYMQQRRIYAKKFYKMQQSYQQLITQDKQCSYCNIPIDEANYVALVLITMRPSSKNFSDLLFQKYELKLGFQSCQHLFHPACILQRFQEQRKQFDETIPAWVKLECPLCITECNILLPMQQEIQQNELINFNKQLIDCQKEVCSLDGKPMDSSLNYLIDIYYQLIGDFINQILVSPLEFVRKQQSRIFQSIINLFTKTIASYKVNGIFFENIPLQAFDKDLTSVILGLMQTYFVSTCSHDIFNIELCKELQKLSKSDQAIIDQLKNIFLISNSFINDQVNEQKEELEEYSIIFKYQQLKPMLANKIIVTMGQNFKQFYDRFFPLKCYKCGSYNTNFQESCDIHYCLLCSKVCCMRNCSSTMYGNLNQHSLEDHSGSAIYISLISGYATIVCSPISVYKCKIIYYHKKLGSSIVQFIDQNWEDFVINKHQINELSDIILKNQYQNCIKTKFIRRIMRKYC